MSGVPFCQSAKIEVEKEGIQFTTDFKPAFLVPDKGRSVITAVLGEGLQAVGGVDEFDERGGEVAG